MGFKVWEGTGNVLQEQQETTSVQVLLACLKECSRKQDLQRGQQVHSEAVKSGHDSNIYVASSLVNMYAKCGCMEIARQLFDKMKNPNVVSWTALMRGYADNGKARAALGIFQRMRGEGPAPDTVTFVAALKACVALAGEGGPRGWAKCRNLGKEIYNLAVEIGCHSHIYVQNTLIEMYAKCGSMEDACLVFDILKHPNVVSWTVLMLGYADDGHGLVALDLFTRMQKRGPAPNSVTVLAALKACTALALKGASGECRDRGKEVYSYAVRNGWGSDVFVQNTLIDMYAKCGCMFEARQVFSSMKHPDLVSWNALILGYASNGQGLYALDLFKKMKCGGPAPDSSTLVAVLKAVSSLAFKRVIAWAECREWGKRMHNLAIKIGCQSNGFVQNTFIDMYAKWGSMVDAREVFDTIKYPDVVAWNALILGYVDNGQSVTALDLFKRMKSRGAVADSVTFAAALKACAVLGALELGREIHLEIPHQVDMILVTCLVDLYAKCGNLMEAQRVFDLHPETRDMITWNALLAGFSSCGDQKSMFEVLERMKNEGFKPNSVTFLCILTCCSHAGLAEKGKELFDGMSRKHGIIPSVEHYTCMVNTFGRTNKLEDAMALLQCMPCSGDDVFWTAILGACRKWKNVGIGRMAFQSLIKFNVMDSASYVLMGQIYESRGMLQEQKIMMGMSTEFNVCRRPGETCWTNEAGETHAFLDE